MRQATEYVVFPLLLFLNGVCCESVKDFDGKIGALETKLESLSAAVLTMSSENEQLKKRVSDLESIVRNYEDNEGSGENTVKRKNEEVEEEKGILKDDNQVGNRKEEKMRGKEKILYVRTALELVRKRIVPPTSLPTEVIAFHAYLSKDSTGPLPAQHILKFDVVPLNRGNGYNRSDGIFIVPVSGTYVFTWAIMSQTHGYVGKQLMKNSDVIGTRYADSATSTVWDFATGTVVASVSQGDHVFVQLRLDSRGAVGSTENSRTTFSGWILH